MKKILLTLIFVSGLSTMSAQSTTENGLESGYNKWSLEVAGGFNKPVKPFTSGYYTSELCPFVVDLGARYMFNNKFGLKANFGYDQFKNASTSKEFNTKLYRFDVQGVANLGRIMNFEDFTHTFGLLLHTGLGAAQANFDNSRANDLMANFIAGLTGQIKLSNRIALTGDFSTIINVKQSSSFDGYSNNTSKLFSGTLFNATVGLTFALGKYSTHADWYATPVVDANEFAALSKKVNDMEAIMEDSDKDGVPDYLDQEPNTITGVMVNTKGQSIDLNKNNIPDELESYLFKTYGDNSESTINAKNNESIKKLINSGYVCTYFDSNSSVPSKDSADGINFILTYLRNNPSSSVDIIGHTDEVGNTEYNDKLALARANAVKKILVNAKIDASRINTISGGEDSSIDNVTGVSRNLVRKVTFTVK